MTLKELREKLTAAAQKIQALSKDFSERQSKIKAGEDVELWPGDSRAQWDAANKEYDELKAQHEAAEQEARDVARAAEVGDWLNRSTADPDNRPGLDDLVPGGDGQTTYGDAGAQNRDQTREYEQRERDLTLAFQAWCSRGVPDAQLRDAHREACERVQFDPGALEVRLHLLDTATFAGLQRRMHSKHPEQRTQLFEELLESRALSSGIGTGGGYLTVPGSVVRAIELATIEYGVMLQVAETITTATGEEMGWPVGDDTDNEAAYTDENVPQNTEAEPGFEQVKWRSHDLNSKFIKVPYRLFRDSFVNIEMLIGRMIGERFGRKISGECTTGTSKIRGLIPRCPVGQTSAAAGAITYDDLVGLEHSVDPSIRKLPGVGYMFHDNILEALRLLKDSESRPLWVSNIAVGAPDTFNGRRFDENQKMEGTIATTNKCVAFGRLSSYKIRRVGSSLRMRRLVERFAEYDQTAFIGYQSVDGNLLRPNNAAACPVKVLQQP